MSPDDYCREKLASAASSVHYSLLFAPIERRPAATALYALQRELDEVVEQASDIGVARAGLLWWAQEIQRMFEAVPQHPATRALAPHLAPYALLPDPFVGSLQVRFQLLEPEPFADFEELARYCYLAAAPFEEAAATMFASSGAGPPIHARELALAVQMIRLMRDVGRHARKGRIVLPMQDLRDYDVRPHDLTSARYVGGFVPLMDRQAERARAALRAAAAQRAPGQRRTQAPGLILAALYGALLEELQQSGFRVLHQRIALTPVRKILIAWRTRMFGPPRGGGAVAR